MISISKFFNSDGSQAARNHLPLVPLRDIVLFPHMTTSIFVGREKSINALSIAMAKDKHIFLATQSNPEVKKPAEKDIYKTGTQAYIKQLLKLPDGTVKVLVEGAVRGQIQYLKQEDSCVVAEYEIVRENPMDGTQAEAASRAVLEAFEKYVNLSGAVSKSDLRNISKETADLSRFSDLIAAKAPFKISDKQQLLECTDIEERLVLLLNLIGRETEVFSMSQKIKGRVKDQMDKFQKKHYLNEQNAGHGFRSHCCTQLYRVDSMPSMVQEKQIRHTAR